MQLKRSFKNTSEHILRITSNSKQPKVTNYFCTLWHEHSEDVLSCQNHCNGKNKNIFFVVVFRFELRQLITTKTELTAKNIWIFWKFTRHVSEINRCHTIFIFLVLKMMFPSRQLISISCLTHTNSCNKRHSFLKINS